MKLRIHFSALLVLAFMLTSSAQVTFGIEAGQLHSWHSTALTFSDQNNSTLKGLSVNVSLYKNLNRFIHLGIEPGIAQRGTRHDYPDFISSSFIVSGTTLVTAPTSSFFYAGDVIHSTYVQLPLLARVQVPLGNGNFGFFIKGGAGVSWVASAYEEIGILGAEGIGGAILKIDFKNNDDFRRIDFGIHSGAGLNLKIGLGQLSLGCIGYYGMSQISVGNDRRNRSIGYSLGYHILLN
ncbi:MAG: outer membrane beta-barrel protein [Bacteroidota bacterium]